MAAPTLEDLLDHVIAEWKQVNTVPTGTVSQAPTSGSHNKSIHLNPSCYYEPGCPKNFEEFYVSAQLHALSSAKAYSWYARANLRYSCSGLTAMFLKHLIPELKASGILELYSTSIDSKINLESLEVKALLFHPPNVIHSIVLDYPMIPPKCDVVEVSQGIPPMCHHHLLMCSETGAIIDPSVGQFMGFLKPCVFRNLDDYNAFVPFDMNRAHLFTCPERDIDEQLRRDASNLKTRHSPYSHPMRLAKRIVRSTKEATQYCSNCYGVAPSSNKPLKRCVKCKTSLYCGRTCQLLHWKSHKAHCRKNTQASNCCSVTVLIVKYINISMLSRSISKTACIVYVHVCTQLN